jgi:hypothetical protein
LEVGLLEVGFFGGWRLWGLGILPDWLFLGWFLWGLGVPPDSPFSDIETATERINGLSASVSSTHATQIDRKGASSPETRPQT